MRLTTEREEIAVPTHCYSALKWALAVQCSKHLKKKNEQTTGLNANFLLQDVYNIANLWGCLCTDKHCSGMD